jgi:CO/xanthine dehydrogenase Mo-binding subunit
MRFGGKYMPVFAQGRTAITDQSPAFSAQLAEVEVDEETGEVHLHELIVAQDVGRAINPMAVEGQMMGGATQGIGWALYEHMEYDDQGQLLSGTWMDYAVPDFTQSALHLEALIVENPSEAGPYGVRGVGEPPVIPTPAAIANAIAHATGVRMSDIPMTPPRVLAALRNGR